MDDIVDRCSKGWPGMELDARDREKILAWNDSLNRAILLRLVRTDDARSKDFAAFGRILSELVPTLSLITEEGGVGELPALALGRGWRYHAIPRGAELDPFLDLMAMQIKGEADLPQTVGQVLREVQWPAAFKVYVSPDCPFCPEVVRRIQAFPLVSANIHLDIIDGVMFPELAQLDRIRSVPTVILDHQFRWTGSIVLQELLDALVHRDPARMSALELIDIIKEGNAVYLAQMMLQRQTVFPEFMELLRHPNWSERLGAMVVLEQIAEENPALARTTCSHLLDYLHTAEDPVKGDLIYLLGAVGCSGAIPFLEKRLTGETSVENREVVTEALEKLQGKETL